ncbi:protein-L-isoaspartate O-methyltransferase [Pseudomaricurvus alkylphenolicus]|nr:protein-L-isoaspartate O-methyltransferase [Pseudomaricurvus alkylphenolicus]
MLDIRVDRALRETDRAHFMPASVRHMADVDGAIPIGYDQTISQPYTVRNMLLWLAPERGDRILDVGSGSGWSTALLSHLVGPEGTVLAVERIAELKVFGENNCLSYGCSNVTFYLAGEELGLPQLAPFDRILVSAAAPVLPAALLDQLGDGGKLVIPVGNSILEIAKDGFGQIDYERDHYGYTFVPLHLPE